MGCFKKAGQVINQQATIKFKVQDINFASDFLVAKSLTVPLILSSKFFYDNKCVLDFSKGLSVGVFNTSCNKEQKYLSNSNSCNIRQTTVEGNKQSEINYQYPSAADLKQHLENLNLEISDESKRKLLGLLIEYRDIFSPYPGLCNLGDVALPLKDKKPYVKAQYGVPWNIREQVSDHLLELENLKIIERCDSPYINPLVCVRKPNGSIRICLDGRGVNTFLHTCHETPQDINDIFNSLDNTKYLTTIDLSCAYWQLAIRPEDRDILAFSFQGKIFRFTRLAYGLNCSSGIFMKYITMVLGPEVEKLCKV